MSLFDVFSCQEAIPFLLHPASHASMTASIFTTVGIALERHLAVCSPFKHGQVN